MTERPRVSVVIPACNEGDGVVGVIGCHGYSRTGVYGNCYVPYPERFVPQGSQNTFDDADG